MYRVVSLENVWTHLVGGDVVVNLRSQAVANAFGADRGEIGAGENGVDYASVLFFEVRRDFGWPVSIIALAPT